MKHKIPFYQILILFTLAWLTACGQKGPLEVERPILIQEEELEETR